MFFFKINIFLKPQSHQTGVFSEAVFKKTTKKTKTKHKWSKPQRCFYPAQRTPVGLGGQSKSARMCNALKNFKIKSGTEEASERGSRS